MSPPGCGIKTQARHDHAKLIMLGQVRNIISNLPLLYQFPTINVVSPYPGGCKWIFDLTIPAACYISPGNHVTNASWAHSGNPVKMNLTMLMFIVIRSDHNFTHVKLLWLVQNCDLIWALCFTLEQHILLTDFGLPAQTAFGHANISCNHCLYYMYGLFSISSGEFAEMFFFLSARNISNRK